MAFKKKFVKERIVMEKGITIVSKIIVDPNTGKEVQASYYADLVIKDGIAEFRVRENLPISEDEVREFKKANGGGIKWDRAPIKKL